MITLFSVIDCEGMYREVSRCRICGNPELTPILDLGTQALTGIFPAIIDENVPSSPLELVKCDDTAGQDTCGLVQLKHSFESSVMYGDHYGYRSGLNQSMVQHLNSKAIAIKNTIALRSGDLVLDIGSNDGTLLRAMEEPGVDLVGMDPSGAKFRQYYPEGSLLVPDFFSAVNFRREFSSKRARVITSIAMFYDLENPMQFMRDIYDVLDDDGVWVFEQSYLVQMLQMNAYDTICHEHLEYYALKQIVWMSRRVGFKILKVELNDVNGGSFSVTVAKAGSAHVEDAAGVNALLDDETRFGLNALTVYREFSDRTFRHREALMACLLDLHKGGEKVLGYGASTKGNVVLQFCGITPALLPAIAEVNPDKFGHFTPKTLIPIISEADAHASKPDVFMVLPWHFRSNIVEREKGFLEAGGQLLFPLPSIELIKGAKSSTHRA